MVSCIMYLSEEQAAMRERAQREQRHAEQMDAEHKAKVAQVLAASNNGRNSRKLREALKLPPPPPVVLPEPAPLLHSTLEEMREAFKRRLVSAKPMKGQTANKAFLTEFVQQSKRISDKCNRILLLQTYADIVIVMRDGTSLRHARRSFNSIKNSRFKLSGQTCWACGMEAQVRHHIIQLQHGGLITAAKNVRLLCKDCHSEIHPWLGIASPPVGAIEMLNERIELVNKAFRDAANGLFTTQAALEDASLEVLNNFFSIANILANK